MRRLIVVLTASLLLAACDSTVDPPTTPDGRVVATAPIQSVSTYAVDPVAPIVLTDHFTVSEGSATFSAVSNAPGIAAATIDAGRLTVRPMGPGTAQITVTATASGGATATQTFTAETLAPCPPAPAGAQDLFPAARSAVWSFNQETRFSTNNGPEIVVQSTATWAFQTPACLRGVRSTSFTQAVSGTGDQTTGQAVQTGTNVALTYSVDGVATTRTFPRSADVEQVLTATCTGSAPFETCHRLTLAPGRGVTEIRYDDARRTGGASFENRAVRLSRTN